MGAPDDDILWGQTPNNSGGATGVAVTAEYGLIQGSLADQARLEHLR